LLDSQRRPIANNRVELTAGRSTGVSYKMIYRADATRNQEFRWRLAGRSSQALEITGTTGVGPIRGIIDDRNPATLSLRAPRSLAGQRHWLRFEVTVDGRVAHEKYLFIDVR
jgi:hypothetical protein